MTSRNNIRRARLGTALTALALALGPVTVAAPQAAQAATVRPSETLNLSQGTGSLVRLPAPMSDVFVANDSVADVQVRSATQLYVFGKSRGETTVYATTKSGKVACYPVRRWMPSPRRWRAGSAVRLASCPAFCRTSATSPTPISASSSEMGTFLVS